MKTIDYRKLITELCRIILGVTFLFSGVTKAVDPVGGALIMDNYFAAFGLTFLKPLSLLAAINLSAIEFLLGVCILTAVYRWLATICMLALMVFMTTLTLYLAIFNPVHDCGCFGEAIILTNWQTFWKNAAVLLPASIVTYVYRKKMTPLYTRKAYWFVALFGYVFPVVFAFYNYYHLPIIDFRPFKIGVNIPEQMSFPEDAPQDVYHFVYTDKDGQKVEFPPELAPAGDDFYTFVERKLIKQGYIPPIISFELYDANETNIADLLLENEKGVFLLIAPSLEKANDDHIDEINNMYDFAVDQHMQFYCVTNSGKDAIDAWIYNTGAEYPFLTADDVTLKTMIRANPGLILLKSGTVLMKWNHRDIPSEETVKDVIDLLLNPTGETGNKKMNQIVWFSGSFVVPLLLVWIYDCLRNRRKKGNINSKE
jgi:hypothetical protein